MPKSSGGQTEELSPKGTPSWVWRGFVGVCGAAFGLFVGFWATAGKLYYEKVVDRYVGAAVPEVSYDAILPVSSDTNHVGCFIRNKSFSRGLPPMMVTLAIRRRNSDVRAPGRIAALGGQVEDSHEQPEALDTLRDAMTIQYRVPRMPRLGQRAHLQARVTGLARTTFSLSCLLSVLPGDTTTLQYPSTPITWTLLPYLYPIFLVVQVVVVVVIALVLYDRWPNITALWVRR